AVRGGLSHRALSVELETVGVVDDAIENGIGKGGLADEVVPGFDGELAGEERGAASMAFLDDLHEIAPLTGGEAVWTEVVQNEQIDSGQHAEEAGGGGRPRARAPLCGEGGGGRAERAGAPPPRAVRPRAHAPQRSPHPTL